MSNDDFERLEEDAAEAATDEVETSAVATAEVEPVPPAAPPEPKMTATVFCIARRAGAAGGAFINEMRRHGPHARKTMKQWQTEWNAFWNRPVRG